MNTKTERYVWYTSATATEANDRATATEAGSSPPSPFDRAQWEEKGEERPGPRLNREQERRNRLPKMIEVTWGKKKNENCLF